MDARPFAKSTNCLLDTEVELLPAIEQNALNDGNESILVENASDKEPEQQLDDAVQEEFKGQAQGHIIEAVVDAEEAVVVVDVEHLDVHEDLMFMDEDIQLDVVDEDENEAHAEHDEAVDPILLSDSDEEEPLEIPTEACAELNPIQGSDPAQYDDILIRIDPSGLSRGIFKRKD